MKTSEELSSSEELRRIVARLAVDPEAIADARQSEEDFAGGRSYTLDQVRDRIREKRAMRDASR